MASSDAKPLPIKNTAFRVTFPILDNTGQPVTGAAGLDSEVSKDGAAFADCTNEATEISGGIYYLDLTSGEMNADTVAVIVKTSTADAKTSVLVFYPQELGDIKVDVESNAGSAITSASGVQEVKVASIAANAITATSIASDAITDAKVASDVTIASVTGAVGSVTGLTASDVAAIKAKTDNLPAAPAATGDIPTATQNADALLKRDWTSVTGEAARSVLNALRFLRNKWSLSGSTLTVTQEDDTTSAWTAAVSTDASADPITGSDPT